MVLDAEVCPLHSCLPAVILALLEFAAFISGQGLLGRALSCQHKM